MSEAVRELLGISYCETCACDTIPSERTGCCFVCDTVLVAQRSAPAPGAPFPKPLPKPKATRGRSPRLRHLHGTCVRGHVLSKETAFIREGRLRCRICSLEAKTYSPERTRELRAG
jgi:hypothetical protein